MNEYLQKFIGQPIAILCNRYWYRGVLTKIFDNGIVLSNPRAVEVTGRSTAEVPETEDIIPSDIFIASNMIELVCQPTWVFHEMKGE